VFETCAGCALSASVAVVMYVTFRSIAFFAMRARNRAMARVESEAG
jgi:hypothetical protein